MMFNMARLHMLDGNLEPAEELFRASTGAREEPVDAAAVDWMTGYMRAVRDPVAIDDDAIGAMIGDYGPRHLRVQDGRLHYARDDAGTATMRPLLAETPDTFVIEGLVSFKLRVESDGSGRPIALVGLYQDGRSDRSERDR
jgi:hypothetical protein